MNICTCTFGLFFFLSFHCFHRHSCTTKQMQIHTHKQAHLSVTRARSSCPVSFESVLRGLTWAATCLSRAGSHQTEQRAPLQHICSSLSLPFLPSPHTSAPCSFGGQTHGHKCTHTFMSPWQTICTGKEKITVEQASWGQIWVLCSEIVGNVWQLYLQLTKTIQSIHNSLSLLISFIKQINDSMCRFCSCL